MFKICCERCWLVLEDIEIIFLNKIDMCLCSGAFCKYNDACFTHVILIFTLNIATFIVCHVSRPDHLVWQML